MLKLIIILATVSFGLGVASYAVTDTSYRVKLVGYGCAGASGPIYANEESDFPMCDDIHAWGG